jgi:hypothetical protein
MSHQSPSSQGGRPDIETFDLTAKKILDALEKDVCPVYAPAPPKKAEDFSLVEWMQFWDSPPRQTLRALGIHIPRDSYVVPVDEPLNKENSTEIAARSWVEKAFKQHKKTPDWNLAEHSGFFPPTPDGQELLKSLNQEVEDGEKTILNTIAEKVFGLDDHKKILPWEFKPIKSKRFRLFIGKSKPNNQDDEPQYTLAVAHLSSEKFKEDKHFYKWLCILPKIAQTQKKSFNRLVVMGLKKSDESLKVDGIELKINIHELDITGRWFADIQELIEKSIDHDSPLMPKTFYVSLRNMLGSSIKADDESLRGKYGSDIKDPRARILIPEEYKFKTINDFASKLMSHGFERIVFSKIKPD